MARKNGDGSFKKLPNGTIEFTVSTGYDIYGKRTRKKFYGKTESECRKKYKLFLKEGEPLKNVIKEYTLSEWLDVYLHTYKKDKVQNSTFLEYQYLTTHINNHQISKLKLSSIKPIHVTDFFSDFMQYSQSIRKRTRSLMYGAFDKAIDNDYIAKNPVDRAEITKKEHGKKDAFSENEVITIKNYAKSDKAFGVAILIMLNTGIRSGEMRALTVNDIDFENAVIAITKSVKATEEIGKPKNGKDRYVPITENFAKYLKTKLKDKTGYVLGGNHFVTSAGFRSRYKCFFERLNKVLLSQGENPIDKKSPHCTRHTYGTLLQKNGMPIAIVSELLGHSSTSVTEGYTHLSNIDVLKEAVSKFSQIS